MKILCTWKLIKKEMNPDKISVRLSRVPRLAKMEIFHVFSVPSSSQRPEKYHQIFFQCVYNVSCRVSACLGLRIAMTTLVLHLCLYLLFPPPILPVDPETDVVVGYNYPREDQPFFRRATRQANPLIIPRSPIYFSLMHALDFATVVVSSYIWCIACFLWTPTFLHRNLNCLV